MTTDAQYVFSREVVCPQYSYLYRIFNGTLSQVGSMNSNCAFSDGKAYAGRFTEDGDRLVVFGVTSSGSNAYVIKTKVGSDPINNPIQLIPNTYVGSISYDG